MEWWVQVGSQKPIRYADADILQRYWGHIYSYKKNTKQKKRK